MRVVIMTAWRHGTASRCFVELVKQPGVEVVGVIYCAGHYRTRKAKLKRQLRKARRIGPFGAVAGLWLRRCYAGPPTEDIFDLAGRHDMPVEITPRTNAPRTRELMRAAKADLGLSLGNDFIALLKDSALLSILAIRELTQMTKLYTGSSFRFNEGYLVLTFVYLTLTLVLSLILQWYGRRVGTASEAR